MEEPSEELHFLCFNVWHVEAEQYWREYPRAIDNGPQAAINAAIIKYVKEAAHVYERPPGAILLQEYKFNNSDELIGPYGLLVKLDGLNLPGSPPDAQHFIPGFRRWRVVRQWGEKGKEDKDAVIIYDSWKYYIPFGGDEEINNPAILPAEGRKNPLASLKGPGFTRLEKVWDASMKDKKLLGQVKAFKGRWAGIQLVLRDSAGGASSKQFLLVSYHGRENLPARKKKNQKRAVTEGKIPDNAKHSLSQEFVLSVNEFAKARPILGTKKSSEFGYYGFSKRKEKGIPALVAGDWNCNRVAAFGAEANLWHLQPPALRTMCPVQPTRDEEKNKDKVCARRENGGIDFAVAVNPLPLANEDGHVLEVEACYELLWERDDAAFRSGGALKSFDHNPLLITCRLIPASAYKASELNPRPSYPLSNEEEIAAATNLALTLDSALRNLEICVPSFPFLRELAEIHGKVEAAIKESAAGQSAQAQVAVAPLDPAVGAEPTSAADNRSSVTQGNVKSFGKRASSAFKRMRMVLSMSRTPSPIGMPEKPSDDNPDRAVKTKQGQSSVQTRSQSGLVSPVEQPSVPKTVAPPPEVPKPADPVTDDQKDKTPPKQKGIKPNCAPVWGDLQKPGKDHTNTRLIEHIRRMLRDLFGYPENTNLSWKKIATQDWWPKTYKHVTLATEFQKLPKDDLCYIYDHLRTAFVAV